MRKITLLLRNATKLDIEKIENYCKVNNIEVCCTDKSVYENGKLVSIEDHNIISNFIKNQIIHDFRQKLSFKQIAEK